MTLVMLISLWAKNKHFFGGGVAKGLAAYQENP